MVNLANHVSSGTAKKNQSVLKKLNRFLKHLHQMDPDNHPYEVYDSSVIPAEYWTINILGFYGGFESAGLKVSVRAHLEAYFLLRHIYHQNGESSTLTSLSSIKMLLLADYERDLFIRNRLDGHEYSSLRQRVAKYIRVEEHEDIGKTVLPINDNRG